MPFWQRQAVRDGVWDIREYPRALVLAGWANLAPGAGILVLLAAWDIGLHVWVLLAVGFALLVWDARDRGVVIDASGRRIWFWRRIVFFRKARVLEAGDFSRAAVVVDKEERGKGPKEHRVSWIVSLSAPSETMPVFRGDETSAGAYASQLRAFLDSGSADGKPEFGTLRASPWRTLLLFPLLVAVMAVILQINWAVAP